jgi:hypothetical protein
MKYVLCPVVALVVASFFGCREESSFTDQNPDAPAINSLRKWAEVISCVVESRLDDPLKYNSCEELLVSWTKMKLINSADLMLLQKDGRGLPFRWSTRRTRDARIIKIWTRSLEKSQEGVLWVEITITGRKNTSISFGQSAHEVS